jgi:hypothetical protein
MSNRILELSEDYRELIAPRDDVAGVIARGEAANRLERLGYHALHHDLGDGSQYPGLSQELEIVNKTLLLESNGIAQVQHGALIERIRYQRSTSALLTLRGASNAELLEKSKNHTLRTQAVVRIMQEMYLASRLQLPDVSGM